MESLIVLTLTLKDTIMIKVVKSYVCDSYFRGEVYYDRKKEVIVKVYFLGIKIWEIKSNFNAETVEEFKPKIGFKHD